jgi:DNA polymerase III alpha subunit (gram-positive type)
MKIVFYDIETSGLIPNKHDIIQIAAIAFSIESGEWNELEEFEIKLEFNLEKADPEALKNNCYDKEVWEKEAVPQKKAIRAFSDFLRKHSDVKRVGKKSGKEFFCCRTAGHNIKNFDDPFVRAFFKKMDIFCPMDFMEVYDTIQLALWEFGLKRTGAIPDNYQLGTLCNKLGIPLENAHDALSDIRANSELAKAILNFS